MEYIWIEWENERIECEKMIPNGLNVVLFLFCLSSYLNIKNKINKIIESIKDSMKLLVNSNVNENTKLIF